MDLKVELELQEEQIKRILKEFLIKNPEILREILEEVEDNLLLEHLKEAKKSPEVDKKEIEKILEI